MEQEPVRARTPGSSIRRWHSGRRLQLWSSPDGQQIPGVVSRRGQWAASTPWVPLTPPRFRVWCSREGLRMQGGADCWVREGEWKAFGGEIDAGGWANCLVPPCRFHCFVSTTW